MAVVMNSYIEVGNYVFRDRIASVQVKSSWKDLADTAVIKLPNLARQSDGKRVEALIQPGDPVLIKLGYDGDLREEFRGYVSSVKPTIPLELHCEDEMWQLKRRTVSESWRSTTLREVLEYLVPEANIDCPDITLSPFRLDNVSVAKALQKLRDEYLLTVYYRQGTLHVGFPYFEQLPTIYYHFQKNAVMEGLEYRRQEDVKVKVKVIGIMPNNTREEIEIGDGEGDTFTLHFYNKRGAELRAVAEQKLAGMKYDGYRGHFIGFGVPRPVHGMVVDLRDDRYPERAGKFFVDTVTTTFQSDGFLRQIELGRRAS